VVAGRHHGTWYFYTDHGPVDWKVYDGPRASTRA
jgi:hypothetical protein